MECDKCCEEFNVDSEPGGLMFSPPLLNEESNRSVLKFHVCQQCWIKIMRFMNVIR